VVGVPRIGTGPLGWLERFGVAVVAALVAVLVLPGAAASAAPAPSDDDRPIWVLPDNGDLLAGFDRNDFDEQDGTPVQVQSPVSGDRQALQFSVEGGGERSELQPRIPDQVEGTVQYYSYNALLAPDFPTGATTWQILMQWHQHDDSGSPPIAVQVRQNRLMLAAEGEDRQDLGPVSGGDRVDLTVRIAFSRDPEHGTVDVWRGGEHVLSGYHPPGGTLLDSSDYMKVGLYRDKSIDEPARFWINDLRVGPTLASVRSPESQSTATPVENDSTGTSSSSSRSIVWFAAGLLLVVVLFAAGSLRRRRARQ
jgi:MYXO-CTERM domain-containing protein